MNKNKNSSRKRKRKASWQPKIVKVRTKATNRFKFTDSPKKMNNVNKTSIIHQMRRFLNNITCFELSNLLAQ